MIKLDETYSLRNNAIHGIELVETKIKKNKKGVDTEYLEVFYFPNPILALQRWITLTSNNTETLEGFLKHYEEINKKLDSIYLQFVNNNRKI